MIDLPLRRAARVVGLGLVCVAVALLVVLAAPQAIGAEASYVVLSDSMEPSFSSGDIVVVQSVPPSEVSTGDVITFEHPPSEAGQTERTSHRVIAVDRSDGSFEYRTQGDANEEPDPWVLEESDLIGQVWFSIPYVGYLVVFAQTRVGILALIVLPGLLLVLTELRAVYRDATVVEE